MVTKRQASSIVAKTGATFIVDKYGLKTGDNNMRQIVFDCANISVTEYFSRQIVMDRVDNMLQGVSTDMKKVLVDVLLDIFQDILVQRFMGSKPRTLTQSLVSFGVAELTTSQLAQRMPDTFA